MDQPMSYMCYLYAETAGTNKNRGLTVKTVKTIHHIYNSNNTVKYHVFGRNEKLTKKSLHKLTTKMNQDLRTNIYNLPYKCPRCECRNFKTVYQLRSHLETDHVFFNNKRQRPKILDYDIRRDTLSGSKSPSLKQFMDENHRLEEELRELKKAEKINKVLRRSSQQTDSSEMAHSKRDSPRRRTERLDPDYQANMSSATSPRIQTFQNSIQHSPTSGQFEFPSPMTNDRYMTDRVDSLSHDVEKSREKQWKTSDALYQSKDVLQGIEVASEVRNQDQAKVLTVLDQTLQQRSDELDKAYKDINQLKEERKVLMNQVEIMTKDRKKIQTHNTSNPSDLPSNVRNESIIDDTAIPTNSGPEDLSNNIQQIGNPGSSDVRSHRSQMSPSTDQPIRNVTPVQIPASLPQNTINNPSSFLPIYQQHNPWLMTNPTPFYQPMLQHPVPTYMTDHRSSFQPIIQPQTQGQMTSNYKAPFQTFIQPHRQMENYTDSYQPVVQQNLPEQPTNNRQYHHPLIQQNIPGDVGDRRSQHPLIRQNIPGHEGDSRSQQSLIQQNNPGHEEDSRSQYPVIQQNIPSQLTSQTQLQHTIQQHPPEQMTTYKQSHHPIQQNSYEQLSDHISPEQLTEQHLNPVPTVRQIQPPIDSPQMIPQKLTDPHNEQMPDSKLEIYKLKIATQEEEMENMNSHLSVIKQKASKELRTKDSQLASALRRSEKLEEDRKVLLLEMEDLLSKAGFDNEKLRYELQLKEKELQNLNQKLERTKHGQAQIVSETFDLYKDAEGNIEELREKLRLKEKELMQSKMKVETIKMAHDKVLEENELVAKEAEKSGQTLKYLLDGKDKELNSVQQELMAIKEKEEKLHREKTDLELKIRNSEKTQQNLKLKMKENERDLSDTKSELEKVQTYLKNTAAKEKVARAELEDFITGLIERSEKAENQLKILKHQVQTEEELQKSLQEAEDEATRSLEELAAAIPKKKREKQKVIEKSASKPNLVKQKKIKTVRYSDEEHNQQDTQKPTSRRTKSHKYNPTYESEDSFSPTPSPRKENAQKRRQSPGSSPVRSSNREYDSDHRHGNPRKSESSKSPTGLSEVDRRPEKPLRRNIENIEKVGNRDELPRNTLANEERYHDYPGHGSYHQPNQQTSFQPVQTQGRTPSSYVSQPGPDPRLRLITPRQPLDPGLQYSSQLNNQNYHSTARFQTPVNHMVINNPHQIPNSFIAPVPINQQTVPANSAQIVPINPSNIQRPPYATRQMHPSLQDPHNHAKGNVQQSGQFSSLPILGSAQIAQQHGMQPQSLPVGHVSHGANLGNDQSPKPDITNLEDLTLRGILTPEEQTAILSSRLHKAMVQQEFLTGKKPHSDDDLRLVEANTFLPFNELQSSDDSEKQFTKTKKKPANNQKALTSSLENRLIDLEELGVLGDQSPTEYENISLKKNHGTARGILLSDSIDATGNDLSVDENGIMWDDAGTTTYASEDLESYRFSPSGSETAGDIDSHQLLSSSSNSNNSNSPRNTRQDTMGQSLDKLNQTPKGKDFHDIRSKISQRRAEREDLTLAIGILKGRNNLSTDDSDLSGYSNDIQNRSKTGRYKGQKLSPLEEDSDGLYKHRYPSSRLNQQDSSENEGSYSLSPARKSRYLTSQQSAPVSNAKSRFLSDMRQTSRSPSPNRSANLTSSSYSPIRSDSRSYSPNLSSSPRSRENSYLGSDLALKYGDPSRMSPKPAPRSPIESRYEQFYSNRVQSPNPHLVVTDIDARMNQSFSSRPISRSPSPSGQFQQPVRETMEKQNIQKDEKKFAFLDDQYRVIPKMNNSPTVTMVPETKTSNTVSAGEKPEFAAGTPNQNKDVTDGVNLENEDKPKMDPSLAPQLNNEIDLDKSQQENPSNQKESEADNELEKKDNVNSVSLSPDIVKYNEVPLKQAKSFLSDVEETELSSDEEAAHAGRGPIPSKEESTDMDFESDIEKLATPHKLGRSGIIGVKGSSKKSGPLLHKKLKTRRHYAEKDKVKDDSSSAFSDSGNKTGQKKQEEAKRRRVALFRIFSYLDFKTLCLVSQICREWKHVSRHPALWKNVKLKNHTISSSFLVTISQWCKQTEYLTLEGLRTRSRYDEESLEEYQRNIRGCVEAGLEEILKNCQDSLISLRIINCGNILTDKCLWLVSGYSRLLRKFHYISDVDPIGPETLWAIGGGCPGITTLIIPPLFPCKKPKVFNNKCLMLLARFYPEMLEIGIGGKEIDQGGLLPLVSGCQRLTFLQLDNMKELTEDLATALCRAGLRHVNTLELRNMPIAPKAIVQFYSSCHHLKRIQIDIHFTDYYDDIKNKKHKTDYKKKIQQLQDLRNKAGLGHILKIYAEQVE